MEPIVPKPYPSGSSRPGSDQSDPALLTGHSMITPGDGWEPHGFESNSPEFAIETQDLSLIRDQNTLLDRVCIAVPHATVHGLFGEAGSGNQLTMRVFAGLEPERLGSVHVFGRMIPPQGGNSSFSSVCAWIPGDGPLLTNISTIQAAMMARRTVGTLSFMDRSEFADPVRRSLRSIRESYDLRVNVDTEIDQLSPLDQIHAAFTLGLHRGCRIFLVDEPGARLSPPERADLYKTLQRVAWLQRCVLITTSKADELFQACDNATVFSGGRVAGQRACSEWNPDALSEAAGELRSATQESSPFYFSRPSLLRLRNIRFRMQPSLALSEELSLDLLAGEIVGIAGGEGHGQQELMEAISGQTHVDSGKIILDRTPITYSNPRSIRQAGLAYIPPRAADRALVGDLSVRENLILGYHWKRLFGERRLEPRRVREHAAALFARFNIRPPHPDQPARFFSTSQRIRMVFARELELNPMVVVTGWPTKDVDFETTHFVHELLNAHRAQGGGTLLFSNDIEQLSLLADRILIIVNGQIVGEVGSGHMSVSQDENSVLPSGTGDGFAA